MNDKQTFINAGFSVLNTENTENKLVQFIKEHYPSVLRDGELNLAELKAVLGLPIDEKVNGYGLNFVGRGVARAKYAQETQKELLLNRKLSKNTDTTQNMVLKGDNLDSLKLLKPHYSGKIKCIYIDPPYNTSSDEFVYPDKFDRHEAEVLGIAENLSDEDFDRMEFSFKTKKSHNGWLAFMYPRLLLARDLLSKDGVIFISIDDNEQANLKLLCDEIFGEENFVATLKWKKKKQPSFLSKVAGVIEYIHIYSKNYIQIGQLSVENLNDSNKPIINASNSISERFFKKGINVRANVEFIKAGVYKNKSMSIEFLDDIKIEKGKTLNNFRAKAKFRTGQDMIDKYQEENLIFITKNLGLRRDVSKEEQGNQKSITDLILDWGQNQDGTNEVKKIFNISNEESVFSNPKPILLIKNIVSSVTNNDSEHIILDFFAGSGTTGHAVMALNAEDGGNRKFILCQIDEPIAKNKPAYQFCKDNGLEPVISSITIERLKRVSSPPALSEGEGAKEYPKTDLFSSEKLENASQSPLLRRGLGEDTDYGFKVFDHTDAPELTQDENGQILFPELHDDALSRIYTMIFKVGLDEPSQAPQEVLENCIYQIGHHYYLTNSEQISKEQFSDIIKDATQNSGKIFVDGWTASLNATLQHYKEEVQIVL